MNGNYNTGNTASLMVVFEKCNPENGVECASESEISAWISGRYIITLTNQKKFLSHKFERERFTATAELSWYPLSNTVRSEYVNDVTRISTNLYDNYMSFADLDEENFNAFTIEK